MLNPGAETLLALILKEQGTVSDVVLSQVAVPDFDKAGRVHDWRRHVSREVRDVWNQLSTESRIAIYYMAQESAMNEEWE